MMLALRPSSTQKLPVLSGLAATADHSATRIDLHYRKSGRSVGAASDVRHSLYVRYADLPHSNCDAAIQREPIQVPDIRNEPASPANEIILREGYLSILIVPLLRPGHIVGALVVRRKMPGEFSQSTIELLQTFADQSVVAIQNARLFESVEAHIIVKQHAGSIEVDSQPAGFTEIRIILPRTATFIAESRGRA